MSSKSLQNYLIHDTATIKEAVVLIQKNESRCVVVINAKRKVIGVFSEGDVLRAILDGVDIHTPLRNIIRPSFKYLLARDAAAERQLFLTGITLVPILTKNFAVKEVLTLNDVFGV